MNKLSIEESLKLLAPSPIAAILNSEKKKTRKKKGTRSPVKIPTVSSIDNDLEDEIEEVKDDRKDLYSYKKEKEKEKKEEEKEEKKEKEDEEILKAPHTPTRFKIETPRTPKRKFNELPEVSSKLNLYDRLKDKRYTLLKYIISEEEDKLIYVVCYDPNGQILFVKIDESIVFPGVSISLEEKNIINIKRNYDDIFPDAFQNAIQERMTIEIQGVVFYDGINYLFSLHHRNGTIENSKYEIINYQDNSKLVICETYTVVNLKEIEKESGVILDITKKNYQLIQQQQQLISKNTSDNIVTSVNNLSNNLKHFNQLNRQYNNNIIDDWGFLGTCSADYYDKYGEGKLTEEEKDKFDKVSINMFARFKAFNEQLMLVNQLNKIIPDIDKASQLINKICEEIEYNDTRMSGNIMEVEDLNIRI
jgi:hypothetical protein